VNAAPPLINLFQILAEKLERTPSLILKPSSDEYNFHLESEFLMPVSF
jgi:hypothetical protein